MEYGYQRTLEDYLKNQIFNLTIEIECTQEGGQWVDEHGVLQEAPFIEMRSNNHGISGESLLEWLFKDRPDSIYTIQEGGYEDYYKIKINNLYSKDSKSFTTKEYNKISDFIYSDDFIALLNHLHIYYNFLHTSDDPFTENGYLRRYLNKYHTPDKWNGNDIWGDMMFSGWNGEF